MSEIFNKNKLFAVFFFFIALLSLSIPAWADTIENDEVEIEFDASLRVSAEEVMRIYSVIKVELEKTFETEIDFKPVVRIIEERSKFHKISGSMHATAVAIPHRNMIIIDNSRMGTHPFTLEVTLKHELCHLLLHHLVVDGRLPRWFNEGVAQWVSGGITEVIIGENKDLLKQATLSGRLIHLRDLTKGFPQDSSSLHLAYQESKSIVDFIVKEHGSDGILRIIQHLREGRTIDSAVLKALSMSLEKLEKQWYIHLKRRHTWFTYFSSNIYELLFAMAGLVLFYGFVRVMLKKRAYKDEEEDNEETNPPK